MKKQLKFSLKLLVSVGLVYLLLKQIDYKIFISLLANIELVYLILPIVLWFLALYLGNIRWSSFLNDETVQIAPKYLFSVSWISIFLSNFLPSNIGGDAFKFAVLKKDSGLAGAKIFASIILDRGVGLLALLLSAIILSIPSTMQARRSSLLLSTIQSEIIILLYVGSLLGCALVLFLLLTTRKFRVRFVSTYEFINRFVDTINTLLTFKNKPVFLKAIFYTFLTSLLSSASLYCQFRAYNTNVAFSHIMIMLPLISVVEMIPISINAVGVKEGAGVFLFGLYGYSPEVIVSVFLMNRFLALLLSSSGGIRYIFFKHARAEFV